MRFFVRATIPHETGNQMIAEGRLAATMQAILEDIKPESVYFTSENGKRCMIMILNMADPSQMPRICEPFFLALNADVSFSPAMTAEDLMKAGPDLERSVSRFAHKRQAVGAH